MAAKFTPPSKLITAIRAGSLDEVTLALNEGADIEEADIHGFVGLPLRTACFEGNLSIVRELLTRGADIHAIASDGPGAPIRLAQRGKHKKVLELLVEHGAPLPPDPNLIADAEILFPAQTQFQEVQAAETSTSPTSLTETDLADSATEAANPFATPEYSPDHIIEFTPTEIPSPSIEEVDLTACYGVDTNLLDFDFQRFQNEQNMESSTKPTEKPEPSKSRKTEGNQ